MAALPDFHLTTAMLLFVTATTLWLPGLLLAATLGVRGWLLAGVAPAVTMGIVGIGAPLAPAIGLGWGTAFFLGWTLLLCLPAGGFALALRRRGSPMTVPATMWSPIGSLTVLAAVFVAAAVATLTLQTGTFGLSSMPQGWDAPYHANAIRYIAVTGNSSPTALGWINVPDEPASFYPNAYHAFEALVFQLIGQDVPHVMNSGMLVTAALAVPLGTVAIIKAAGGSAGFAAAAALVSTSFASYPFDLWQWGQLFPYAAGLSMMLPFLALVMRWLDSGFDRLGALVAVCAAGLAATHSAMMFVAVILGGLHLVQRMWPSPVAWARRELVKLALAGVATAVLSIAYLLGATTMAGNTSAYDWPAITSPSRALGDGLLLGHDAPWPQYLLAALTLCGVFLLFRTVAWRWVAAGYVVFLVLFVVAVSLDSRWATLITSPWWNDRWRLMAVLILPATIAAGWALQALARFVAGWVLARWRSPRLVPLTALGLVGALLAVGYLVQASGYAVRNGQRMQWDFRSPVVLDGERAGMTALRDIVKPGERVMNEGADGTVWTYALSGVEPVIGHYNDDGFGPRRDLLLAKFNRLEENAEVAKVIRDLNVRYVMVSEGFIAWFKRSPGLTGLDRVPALTLRYGNAEFQLYEIDWSRLA